MSREKSETRRARERARYESDPEYREKIKARQRASYQRNKEARAAQVREYRRKNPQMQWRANLKRYEGMTLEDWWALLIAQSGRCAICCDPMTSPHVDHNHATEAVRGLLCDHCNHGLGKFRDDPGRLRAAADYLLS